MTIEKILVKANSLKEHTPVEAQPEQLDERNGLKKFAALFDGKPGSIKRKWQDIDDEQDEKDMRDAQEISNKEKANLLDLKKVLKMVDDIQNGEYAIRCKDPLGDIARLKRAIKSKPALNASDRVIAKKAVDLLGNRYYKFLKSLSTDQYRNDFDLGRDPKMTTWIDFKVKGSSIEEPLDVGPNRRSNAAAQQEEPQQRQTDEDLETVDLELKRPLDVYRKIFSKLYPLLGFDTETCEPPKEKASEIEFFMSWIEGRGSDNINDFAKNICRKAGLNPENTRQAFIRGLASNKGRFWNSRLFSKMFLEYLTLTLNTPKLDNADMSTFEFLLLNFTVRSWLLKYADNQTIMPIIAGASSYDDPRVKSMITTLKKLPIGYTLAHTLNDRINGESFVVLEGNYNKLDYSDFKSMISKECSASDIAKVETFEDIENAIANGSLLFTRDGTIQCLNLDKTSSRVKLAYHNDPHIGNIDQYVLDIIAEAQPTFESLFNSNDQNKLTQFEIAKPDFGMTYKFVFSGTDLPTYDSIYNNYMMNPTLQSSYDLIEVNEETQEENLLCKLDVMTSDATGTRTLTVPRVVFAKYNKERKVATSAELIKVCAQDHITLDDFKRCCNDKIPVQNMDRLDKEYEAIVHPEDPNENTTYLIRPIEYKMYSGLVDHRLGLELKYLAETDISKYNDCGLDYRVGH